ncbi:MAG: transporter, partial [Nitrospirae bacterium]
MRNLTLIILSLLLISCAVGPDYTSPDVPKPEAFRMAEAEGPSIANLSWWELLKDEELQKLIRIALEENKDLKQATATIEEFEAKLLIARMDYAPQMG